MFLLYVNDINNFLGLAVCNIYADVLIYHSGCDIEEVDTKLQCSFDNIKLWHDNNMLAVNSSKCNTMLVAT